MAERIVTIIGMGRGIGKCLAQNFANEGFQVVMIARRMEVLREIQKELQREGYTSHPFTCDAGDEEALKACMEKIREDVGDTDVLIYNAASIKQIHILQETATTLTEDFKVNVSGALVAVKSVYPGMKANGSGTIFFTGAGFANAPDPQFGSLAIGKAGIRNLSFSLQKVLEGDSIRVCTITISKNLSKDDPKYNVQEVGKFFLQVYQDKQQIQGEVVY
ncbi:MAG: SDR family NAD(P)-dependent oxidoreductase [Spirochaetota bacterium]